LETSDESRKREYGAEISKVTQYHSKNAPEKWWEKIEKHLVKEYKTVAL
jgi:hypothetical protein